MVICGDTLYNLYRRMRKAWDNLKTIVVLQILLGGYSKVCQSIFILGVKLARSFWNPAVGDPPKLGFPNCGVHQEKASISLPRPG